MMTAEARQYFSLNDLDRKLERYFDFDGGVFFEAGANDGLNQSNTAYFEKYRGWTGVLVEPIVERLVACRRNRPNARCVWGALTPPEWPEPYVELRYCDLMTVTKADATEHFIEQHVGNGSALLHDERRVSTIYAPPVTITSAMRAAGLSRVDILSLDVEGFELQALKGLDLDAFDVRALCIESWNFEAVSSHLAGRYRLEARLSEHDYLFVKAA